jgi:hypothetical protein
MDEANAVTAFVGSQLSQHPPSAQSPATKLSNATSPIDLKNINSSAQIPISLGSQTTNNASIASSTSIASSSTSTIPIGVPVATNRALPVGLNQPTTSSTSSSSSSSASPSSSISQIDSLSQQQQRIAILQQSAPFYQQMHIESQPASNIMPPPLLPASMIPSNGSYPGQVMMMPTNPMNAVPSQYLTANGSAAPNLPSQPNVSSSMQPPSGFLNLNGQLVSTNSSIPSNSLVFGQYGSYNNLYFQQQPSQMTTMGTPQFINGMYMSNIQQQMNGNLSSMPPPTINMHPSMNSVTGPISSTASLNGPSSFHSINELARSNSNKSSSGPSSTSSPTPSLSPSSSASTTESQQSAINDGSNQSTKTKGKTKTEV